jgi:hypothetical protein
MEFHVTVTVQMAFQVRHLIIFYLFCCFAVGNQTPTSALHLPHDGFTSMHTMHNIGMKHLAAHDTNGAWSHQACS